jgi:hypothetical protein
LTALKATKLNFFFSYRITTIGYTYYFPIIIQRRVFVQSLQSKTGQHNTFSRATFKQQAAIQMLCPLRKTPSQAKVLPRHFITGKHFVRSTIESLFCLNSESTSTICSILHIFQEFMTACYFHHSNRNTLDV